MTIGHHFPDVQIFQPDELVFFNELAAEFMVKVSAWIGNLSLQACQTQPRLYPLAPPCLLP
jgi:hypothetical protein